MVSSPLLTHPADKPFACSAPKLSLLVCTIGRGAHLTRLFNSLIAQTRSDFDVVVVDQNEPGVLDAFLAPFQEKLPILRVFSSPGLSHARNVGLAHCRGDIVAFPDDDCWYPPRLVEDVIDSFTHHSDHAVLTGRTLDAEGKESLGLFHATDQSITKKNVWFAGNSNSLFVRREVASRIGGFDETLGVGAATPFKSGEETDFVLRVLASGEAGVFRRSVTVHHDQVIQQGGRAADLRAIGYSRGFGRVLRLHHYGTAYVCYRLLRTLASAGVALLRRDMSGARYKLLWAGGTLHGYAHALTGRNRSVGNET